MAETAGYLTTVKIGGTATTLTNEPTTRTVANTAYQITDAAKRVLDPTAAPTVEVDPLGGGAWQAAGAHTVDYYTGTITFAADQGGSALVRVSGNYIPLLSVASGRAASISRKRDILDATKFNTTGFKSFAYGMLEASGDLELLEDGFTDHDSGAGTRKLAADIEAATLVFLEIDMGGQGSKTRCWALLEGFDTSTPVAEMMGSKLQWKASSRGYAAVLSTT